MNRLYVVETAVSITGAKADHRLALPAGADRGLGPRHRLRARRRRARAASERRRMATWVRAVAADLPAAPRPVRRHRRGPPAGRRPPAGPRHERAPGQRRRRRSSTPTRSRPARPIRPSRCASWPTTWAEAGRGAADPRRQPGLHRAGRPASSRSGCSEVPLPRPPEPVPGRDLAPVPVALPRGPLPRSWGDTRAFDGTASLAQPLIEPLYQGRSAHELLSSLLAASRRTGFEIVKRPLARAARRREKSDAATSRTFWQTALHDGVIAGTQFRRAGRSPSRRAGRSTSAGRRSRPPDRRATNSSSSPTRRSTTAASPTTAGCRSCPSRSPG